MYGIKDTEPCSMDNEVLTMILRDRQSRWSLDYWRNTESTGFDLPLHRTERKLEEKGNILASATQARKDAQTNFESRRKTLASIITEAKKQGTPAQIRAEKELEKAEKELEEAERAETFQEYEYTVLEEKSDIHDLKMKQFMQRYRNRSFRRLRNKLQLDGDVDYVRRAITWTYEYTQSWYDIAPPAFALSVESPRYEEQD